MILELTDREASLLKKIVDVEIRSAGWEYTGNALSVLSSLHSKTQTIKHTHIYGGYNFSSTNFRYKETLEENLSELKGDNQNAESKN
jgi:hypothetical protein